jgi:hypothetical protein
MAKPEFNNSQVAAVSAFLQSYMRENNIPRMTANECAKLLAKNGILFDTIGSDAELHFRQMLRGGKDSEIDLDLVKGAEQIPDKPNGRWKIFICHSETK